MYLQTLSGIVHLVAEYVDDCMLVCIDRIEKWPIPGILYS